MSRKHWIQHPETLELIPAEEYIPPARSHHYVIPDIKPYLSTIDGRPIMSRSTHRQHLREHGCVEVGTEWNKHVPERREKPMPSPVPDILRAFEQSRK